MGTREGDREGESVVSSDTDSAILKKLRMIIRYDQIILSGVLGFDSGKSRDGDYDYVVQ